MQKTVICVLGLLVFQLGCLPVCHANELKEILDQVGALPLPEFTGSLESFVEKHPTNAMARFELAKSYLKMKQGEAAEEQLRTCMTLVPVGSDLHNSCISQLKEMSLDKMNRLPNGVSGSERSVAPMTGVTSSFSPSAGTKSHGTTTWSAPTVKKALPSSAIIPTSTKAQVTATSVNKPTPIQAQKQSKK